MWVCALMLFTLLTTFLMTSSLNWQIHGVSRGQHAALALSDQLLVLGGLELDSVLGSCWSLNSASYHWSRLADMLTPRADHATFLYQGKVYVCGGWNEDASGRQLVPTLDCYNPADDTWRVVTTVPTPRYHAGVVLIGNSVYVMGGFHSDATFDRATGIIECYNLELDEWHTEKAYPRDIWEHTCVALHVPRCRQDMPVMLNVQ